MVYVGRQLATDQRVAIKVLRAGDDVARRQARFARELELGDRLRHPHVVHLLDRGHTDDGAPCAMFALVPGEELRGVLAREGGLAPGEARHLMLQVLDALAAIHAAGIVHRDLKPANILIDTNRRAVVADFGLAALIGEPSAPVGTPAYAAPEQLRGEPARPRSDLYAWALMFLECLTGERVVAGEQVADVICAQLGPAPVAIPPRLAEHPLGELLRRALAKPVADRAASARGLWRALAACDVTTLPAPTVARRPARALTVTESAPIVPTAAVLDEPSPLAIPATIAVPRDEPAMIGRAGERAALRACWRRACAGEGQSVLVTGEPGIGKSRLVRDLASSLAGTPHTWLAGNCTPDATNNAWQPIVELLASVLGARSLDPLIAKLTELGVIPDIVPWLAPLLAIPLDERFPARQDSQQQHTQAAVCGVLRALAARQPVLLAIEDVQWVDPSTRALLVRLINEPIARLCVVLTSRQLLPGVPSIALGRLPRDEIDALATARAGVALPRDLLDRVAERSDGVPLFVEEVVPMLLAGGRGAIPATLHDLLAARLDRLAAARATAQIAAALGRDFELDLLIAVSPRGARVHADVDALVAAELVFRAFDRARYTFKHALIRDTAYASMGEAIRRDVHARIADVLEVEFPAVVRDRPEQLAHHHAAADRMQPAIGYAQQAAQAALRRSANAEAIGHARLALGWIGALDSPHARAEAELALNGVILPALMAGQGFASHELAATATRSSVLLDAIDGSPQVTATAWALFTYHFARNQRDRAEEVAARFYALAEQTADREQRISALMALAMAIYPLGRMREACELAERALAGYDPIAHRGLVMRYGLDVRANAHAILCTARWFLGEPEASLAHAEAALAWARELAHPANLAGVCFGVACTFQYRGERAQVIARCDELRAIAARHEIPLAMLYGDLLRGWAENDLTGARAALAALEAVGYQSAIAYWSSLVAEVEAAHGELDAALARLARCLACADDTASGFYVPELHCLQGEYTFRRDPRDRAQAEAYFRTAIDVARHRGLKISELHATRALHELQRSPRMSRAAPACELSTTKGPR